MKTRRLHICNVTRQTGTRTCRTGAAELTCTGNPLQLMFRMIISPISSHISASCSQLDNQLSTRRYFFPLYLAMPWSWVNTMYVINQVLHYPNIDWRPLPARFWSLGRCSCTLLCTECWGFSFSSGNDTCLNKAGTCDRSVWGRMQNTCLQNTWTWFSVKLSLVGFHLSRVSIN
jgi:hypothetical protein